MAVRAVARGAPPGYKPGDAALLPHPHAIPAAGRRVNEPRDSMLDEARLAQGSLGGHLARGSAWMVAWRWTVRLIGLVNTLIIARLLTPEDFGLVAMAMLVVEFLTLFADTGYELALIRVAKPTRQHFDAAFTFQLMVYGALAAVLLAVAPVAALGFGDPRVEPILQALALRSALSAVCSVGVISFRMNLDFARDFRFGVYRKLVSFAITVSLVATFRSYWALVWGIVLAELGEVVLGYLMHPYRPRLSLARMGDIASFSAWMVAGNISGYLTRAFDQLCVARTVDLRAMGHYNVALDVATAPTLELVTPVSRAVFPVFSRYADDAARLRQAYRDLLSIVAVVALSTAAGVALVAQDMVYLVLGGQWLGAAPLVVWFALGAAAVGLADGALNLLNVLHRERQTAGFGWARTAVIVALVALAATTGSVERIAQARALGLWLVLPPLFWLVCRAIDLPWTAVVGCLWRPALAAAGMAVAVTALRVEALPAILRLLLDIAVGGASFAALLLLMWWLAGRPAGAERLALDALKQRLGRA